nr:bifunctional diguanylate cyclase/phosphodiesterase [Oceanirhabdus seepicola]
MNVPIAYLIVGVVIIVISLSSTIIFHTKFLKENKEVRSLREIEERFRILINSSPNLIGFKDGFGRYVDVNKVSIKVFNFDKVDYKGKTDIEIVEMNPMYKECLLKCKESDDRAWELREPICTEERVLQEDGSYKIYDVIKVPIFSDNGERKALTILGHDVTELKKVNEKLRESEEWYRLAVEGANDGIWEYNLKKDITYISSKSMSFIGVLNMDKHKRREVWNSYIHPEDFWNVKQKMNRHLKGETEQYICEYRIKNKDGEYVWIYSRGKALLNEKGVPYRVTGFHTDITDIKKNEERINYLAYYDEVTGVHNKAFISNKVEELQSEGFEKGRKHALLVMDIDDFKYVNELIGHVLGDCFLKEVAKRIKSCIPPNSILSRYSGDEFIILLYDIESIEDVRKIVDKVLKALGTKFDIINHQFFISESVGITIFPEHGESFRDIFTFAEIAMNKAKRLGKNKCVFFDKSMKEEIGERVLLEKNLYEAIENKEFIVAYQLQKDLKSDSYTGAEALVRWMHPEKGLIPPNKFIPLAEETGLIVPIGKIILKEACQKIKELQDKGYKDLSVSVNISIGQLKAPNFVDLIENIIKEIEFEPKLLTLEITESILMESFTSSIEKIEQLRELGIKIALDDFGTGYSSFNYLRKLPIDILKIDKSFVDEIETNLKQKAIVGGIISVAKELDFKVVAEGVEKIEQLEILKEQDCDKIQGYIFSKPLFENEFDKMLLDNNV